MMRCPSWSLTTIATVDLDTAGFIPYNSGASQNNQFGEFYFTGTTGTSTASIIVDYNNPDPGSFEISISNGNTVYKIR